MSFTVTDTGTLVLSLLTIVYVLNKVKVPFRRHTMNIYQYQMYILILFALFTRSILFLTTIGSVSITNNPRMVGLIWSWPVFCMQMAGYILTQRWAYDINQFAIGYEQRHGQAALRQHFAGFIKVIQICVVVMYLVYMFSLPSATDLSDLEGFCQFIGITSFIIAAVQLCVLSCGVLKSVREQNRELGNVIIFEALVYFAATIVMGLFCIWLGKGQIFELMSKQQNGDSYTVAGILVPYFMITEFLPSCVFAYTVLTFQKHFTKNFDDRVRELVRQRLLAREQRRILRQREEMRVAQEYQDRQPEIRNTVRELMNQAYPDADQQDPFLLNGNDHFDNDYRVGDDIFDDYGRQGIEDDEEGEFPIEEDNQRQQQQEQQEYQEVLRPNDLDYMTDEERVAWAERNQQNGFNQI